MRKNIIKEKSFNFAVDIVELSKVLIKEHREFVISKQILRSGTSIGANVSEAQNVVSKKDFKHKLSISQKEADETLYWLELLERTDYLTEAEFKKLHKNVSELIRIIRTIILNTKEDVK